MMKYLNIKAGYLFIFLLFIVSWLYNYPGILSYPPYSIHAWRQADCLSFTLNFYKENLKFWEPAINGLGGDGQGRTVSEFPIIYYTVAQLWKIFGQKEAIFRIINISIVFFGLFNLHRLGKSILKDTYYSIAIPLFLFTAPVLAYYTNNFLADAPAFGLALSACYFLYRYLSLSDNKAKWYALLLFLLGGLVKISSLLIFFSIAGALIIELLLNYKHIDKAKFKNLVIGFFIILILIGAWYMYARHYNFINNNQGFFLQSIFPIWELTAEHRKYIFDCLYFSLLPAFFNRIAFAVILLLFFAMLVFYRKVNRFLLRVCVFCFLGILSYFFLFFQAFDVHDYYLTNLIIFVPLVSITFFEFLVRNYPKVFHNNVFKIALSLMLVFLIFQTSLKNRLRYDSRKYIGRNLVISKSDREYFEWYHWNYANTFKAFETIKPYLRSLGIVRTDKVICFADESINISLYLMDQKGYTKFGYSHLNDTQRVEFGISKGCKYLIIRNDQTTLLEELKPFLTHQIGQYQNINIYSLDDYIKSHPKQ